MRELEFVEVGEATLPDLVGGVTPPAQQPPALEETVGEVTPLAGSAPGTEPSLAKVVPMERSDQRGKAR